MSHSIALALKYRPTTFSDLIGQDSISQTLSRALDSKRLSHAYLFSGLRGSGKTSSARIFARCLQCEQGPTSNPCGVCDNCTQSLQNRHIDIIEMDAASSTGINDIKHMVIEQTNFAPSLGRYKIFIIDEVHMLSKSAFNAMLKTLEEPPAHVKFILATTDPLQLPATILSRTQHFRFKQIPHRLVIEHIENILNKEGVSFESSALEMIARNGKGSLRDTITLLDQAIPFCKNHINAADVAQMLGAIDPKVIDSYFQAIISKDSEQITQLVNLLKDYECEMIIEEMMFHLKDCLLNGKKDYPALLVDRFTRILSESKYLLSLNADGAFVLLLNSLKMQEATKIKDIESMIEQLEGEVFNTRESKIESKPTQNINNAQNLQNSQNLSNPQNLQSLQNNKNADSINLSGAVKFENLIKKIYDRSVELGECFEKSIKFISFENDTLTWQSNPQTQHKATLIKHYAIIKQLACEVFGSNTNIVAIKSQTSTESSDSSKIAESSKAQDSINTQDFAKTQESTKTQESGGVQDSNKTIESGNSQFIQNLSNEQKDIINAINDTIGIKNVITPTM